MENGVEEMVYIYLTKNHRGHDNLIKNKDLREKFNIKSDKTMRKIIQNIRSSKDYPEIIGSISGKRGGFFTCINSMEEQATINNIKHRANQMLRMTHILEWKKEKEI